MKVEVAIPGSPSLIVLYGLCGRKATLEDDDFPKPGCLPVKL